MSYPEEMCAPMRADLTSVGFIELRSPEAVSSLLDKKEGTVKWFNNSKGYGFIQAEGEKDYFVHMNEILMEGFKTLAEEQKVEFEVGEGPKGPVAKKVNPL